MKLASEPHIAVVPCRWSAEALARRVSYGSGTLLVDENDLAFVYHGKASEVHLAGGIQLPLSRLADTELWALTVRVRDASQAVVSYGFRVDQGDEIPQTRFTLAEWRGPAASPPARRADPLRGRLNEVQLASTALGEMRELTVYRSPGYDAARQHPVVWMADGQSTADFAAVLEPLIDDGVLPDLALIGVHSPSGSFTDPADDLRAQEYLPSLRAPRFKAHAQFFAHEARAWAETALGVAAERHRQAVFGFSNGGVFTASMGAMFPNVYGAVLAFSLGMQPKRQRWPQHAAPRYYLLAGTLEEGFYSATRRFAAELSKHGHTAVFRERVCGHEYLMWREEFGAAVAWAFGNA
jgi:enterochelin esterase-like enzyme